MKLGLIAGNGRFPFLVLDAARSMGYEVTVVAIKEEASTDLDAEDNVVDARENLSDLGLAKGRRVRAGSVLVTCIGSIGKTGLAQVDCATNQQINAVSPYSEIADPRFVYWWTVSPDGQRQLIENASATTLPILNKSKFSVKY